MGGKNAIIVDDDADLDEAVLGVHRRAPSAIAGQKCSACSRAIVLESVYDAFLERLVEAARSLKVGPPKIRRRVVGPVIDEESQQRVNEYIEIGRRKDDRCSAVDVGSLAQTRLLRRPAHLRRCRSRLRDSRRKKSSARSWR